VYLFFSKSWFTKKEFKYIYNLFTFRPKYILLLSKTLKHFHLYTLSINGFQVFYRLMTLNNWWCNKCRYNVYAMYVCV